MCVIWQILAPAFQYYNLFGQIDLNLNEEAEPTPPPTKATFNSDSGSSRRLGAEISAKHRNEATADIVAPGRKLQSSTQVYRLSRGPRYIKSTLEGLDVGFEPHAWRVISIDCGECRKTPRSERVQRE